MKRSRLKPGAKSLARGSTSSSRGKPLSVREASLADPSRGYGEGPTLTDEQLAEHGQHELLREEAGCEWCRHPDAIDVSA